MRPPHLHWINIMSKIKYGPYEIDISRFEGMTIKEAKEAIREMTGMSDDTSAFKNSLTKEDTDGDIEKDI